MRLLESFLVPSPVPTTGALPSLTTLNREGCSAVAQLRNALWRLEEIQIQRRSLVELEAVLLREIKALELQCRDSFIVHTHSDLTSVVTTFSEADSSEGECNVEDATSRQATTYLVEESSLESLDGFGYRPYASFWPLAMTARGGCLEVVRKYVRLPVTLYCGRDTASKEVERMLGTSLADSLFVRFGVQHFGLQDPCVVDTFLSEQVALICLRCDDIDKDAGTAFGRVLSEMLARSHKRTGNTNEYRSAPAAVACFIWGNHDEHDESCRKICERTTSIALALEGLGSTSLLRCVHVHETMEQDVMQQARRWAINAAQQAQRYARGQWVPEPEDGALGSSGAPAVALSA